MQLTRRAILGIVLIGTLSATLAIPEACAAQNLWAWVKKEQRYVARSQSVPGNARLVGTFAYSIGINNYGPSVVKNAIVEFTSSRRPKDLIADTWGVGASYSTMPSMGTYATTYMWTMPDIAPKSYQVAWFNTPIGCTFTPGFDSSREVTPTLIESASAIQTVRVKVKSTQIFSALYIGVSLSGSDHVEVELVKGSDGPPLADRYSTHMFWWVEHPQVNRIYEFSVKLKLTNLIFPSRVDFLPWTEVQAYESREVNPWSSSEWHGTTQADPDISVWDVRIGAPGNSQSKVALEVTRTVGYLDSSTAQLKTAILVEGLPLTQSSFLYTDRNGVDYYLEVDGNRSLAEYYTLTETQRSTTIWLSKPGHDIRAPKVISGDPGVRYYCEDDAVRLSDSDISFYLQKHSFSHTFKYVKQFFLRFDSWAEGNYSAEWRTEWFDAGRTITVEAHPFAAPEDLSLLLRAFGFRYRFSGWNGTADGTSPRVSFVLEKPMSITALWSVDYSQIVPRVGITAVFMGLVALALLALLVTWKTAPGVDFDLLLQRLETLKASGAISESAYARLRSEYETRKRRR